MVSSKTDKAQKASKQAKTSATLSNLFFLRCFHHLVSSQDESHFAAFLLTIECKLVNYKNALELFSPFPNAAPKKRRLVSNICAGYAGIGSFRFLLFSWLFSSLLAEAWANLSGNLVSEWCVVCEVGGVRSCMGRWSAWREVCGLVEEE
jgi:hypothetical protein